MVDPYMALYAEGPKGQPEGGRVRGGPPVAPG